MIREKKKKKTKLSWTYESDESELRRPNLGKFELNKNDEGKHSREKNYYQIFVRQIVLLPAKFFERDNKPKQTRQHRIPDDISMQNFVLDERKFALFNDSLFFLSIVLLCLNGFPSAWNEMLPGLRFLWSVLPIESSGRRRILILESSEKNSELQVRIEITTLRVLVRKL